MEKTIATIGFGFIDAGGHRTGTAVTREEAERVYTMLGEVLGRGRTEQYLQEVIDAKDEHITDLRNMLEKAMATPIIMSTGSPPYAPNSPHYQPLSGGEVVR